MKQSYRQRCRNVTGNNSYCRPGGVENADVGLGSRFHTALQWVSGQQQDAHCCLSSCSRHVCSLYHFVCSFQALADDAGLALFAVHNLSLA